MEAYGTQELSSIPIEAGKDKDLKVKVTPPANVTAGDYPVAVQASSEGASADTKMTMSISGQPKLKLSGEDGRLNAEAEAGSATPIKLTVEQHRQRARRRCRAERVAAVRLEGRVPARQDRRAGAQPEDATCRRC